MIALPSAYPSPADQPNDVMMTEFATDSSARQSHGNTIFEGLRFWVAHRVPLRDWILEKIKSNGGSVVPLEKYATYLIGDDLKNNGQPGMHSYRLIEDSVKEGRFKEPDCYLIGDQQCDIPSSQRAGPIFKRTPFTLHDDIFLARWILSNRHPVQGHVIYLKLEHCNPRHSWQSWRARFVKTLKSYGMEYIKKLAKREIPKELEENLASHLKMQAKATNTTTATWLAAIERSKTPRLDLPVEPTPEAEIEERNLFFEDLDKFYKGKGVDFEKEPLVGSQTVDLWDLSTSVSKQNVSLDEVNWAQVARDLHYDYTRDKEIAGCLQRCFKDLLQEFFEHAPDDESEYISVAEESSTGMTAPIDDKKPSRNGCDSEWPSSRAKRHKLADSEAEAVFAQQQRHQMRSQSPIPPHRPDQSHINHPEDAADETPRSPPRRQSTARLPETIEECVQGYEQQGFPRHIVLKALWHTTMKPGKLALLVMQSLRDGAPVPCDHRGIWTDRDDSNLRLADAKPSADADIGAASRTLERLQRKHGKEHINKRRQFLSQDRSHVKSTLGFTANPALKS